MASRPTAFHQSLPIDSKIIREKIQTDRQADDLISLILFLESRLKMIAGHAC
jgi:hypothetical protein